MENEEREEWQKDTIIEKPIKCIIYNDYIHEDNGEN